jgi:hypothetical protein
MSMSGRDVLDWDAFFAQRQREGALTCFLARLRLLLDLSCRDWRQKPGALRPYDAPPAGVPGRWTVSPPFLPAA